MAALPAASRSRILNRPVTSGLDGRSADARALRDLTAELLRPLGNIVSTRAVLLAKAVARCQIELGRLETLEASGVAEVIARADAIAGAAKRLGQAFRRLDSLLAAEPQAGKQAANPVRDYLRNKAAAEAAA